MCWPASKSSPLRAAPETEKTRPASVSFRGVFLFKPRGARRRRGGLGLASLLVRQPNGDSANGSGYEEELTRPRIPPVAAQTRGVPAARNSSPT